MSTDALYLVSSVRIDAQFFVEACQVESCPSQSADLEKVTLRERRKKRIQYGAGGRERVGCGPTNKQISINYLYYSHTFFGRNK